MPSGKGRRRGHRARPLRRRRESDRTLLIESVLEPSRQILDGYRLTAVATTAGQVFSGIVKQESDKEVTLVDAQGLRQVIRKSEIEQRTAGHTSLMPDGVTAGLSQSDVADLIAFLTILRSAAQGTPGSGVTGPISCSPAFRASGSRPESRVRRRWP